LKFIDKELMVFDLDGTLIDSAPDLALAVNYTLERLNRDTFADDVIRTWVGNGAETLVKRALSGGVEIDPDIDRSLLEKALTVFLDFYSRNLSTSTVLYAGVKPTLFELKERGYTLAIVTNKPHGFVAPILKHFGLDKLFALVLGGDSLPSKKPNPEPLLYVCKKLGISVNKTLMVGDSKNDILASNSAGIHSIGVTYGYNYDEDISVYNPTVVLNSFKQILARLPHEK